MRVIAWVLLPCVLAAAPAFARAAPDMGALVEKFFSPDRVARDAAVKAIGALGPQKLDEMRASVEFQLGPVVSRMLAEERSSDPMLTQVLAEATRAAAAMGPPAAVPLARMATTGKVNVESEIGLGGLIQLGQRASAARPVLGAALDSEDFHVRWAAGKALAAVDAPGWPLLAAALRSTKSDKRESAAIALGYTHSHDAAPLLLKALADAESGVRSFASSAIKELGPAAAGDVARLLPFEDVSPGDLAKVGDGGVPALAAALSSPDAAMAGRAAATLGLMTGSASLAALTTAWETGNSPTRRAAAGGVVARYHNLEKDLRPAVATLIEGMVGSADASRRLDVVNAFGDFGPPLRPALEALTRDPDARVREVAKTVMAKHYPAKTH